MFELSSKPLLMGILNITPDSFSDGGCYFSSEHAIEHASEMLKHGADMIDIGGESTRPGAGRVSIAQQLERVLPVIEVLKSRLPDNFPMSIDTTRSQVAEAAISHGANMINDVSAGREDPEMFALAASYHIPIIIMHMQGEPGTMQDNPRYHDVVNEIKASLLQQAQLAVEAGVRSENVILDPGIGFGKTKQNNLDLIAHLGTFVSTAYPVMLGASRKRFMGKICALQEYSELLGATCATTALAVNAGVKIIRVHDIKENRQALDLAWAIKNSG